jgi:uncharacterized RDD family membrane protein YckC
MRPALGDCAGTVSRGIAFVLDATAAVLVCTVGFELAIAVLGTIGVTSGPSGGAEGALGYVIVLPLVFGAYCAGSWSLVGRTPGMFLLGLRVVKLDGAGPGLCRSVVRAVAYWVSAIFMLGFVWIAFDRQRQGFHDKIAGTLVIYDWPARVPAAHGRGR